MDVILVLTGNNSCRLQITICFASMRSRHAFLFNDIPRPALFTFIDIRFFGFCFIFFSLESTAALSSSEVYNAVKFGLFRQNRTFHLVSFDHWMMFASYLSPSRLTGCSSRCWIIDFESLLKGAAEHRPFGWPLKKLTILDLQQNTASSFAKPGPRIVALVKNNKRSFDVGGKGKWKTCIGRLIFGTFLTED